MAHVVGHVGVLGHDAVQRRLLPQPRVGRVPPRRARVPGEREEVEEGAGAEQGVHVVFARDVRHARHRRVRPGAAELVEGDLLVRHRLDDVGARDEEVRRVLHHDDEVGDGGRVDGAPRARPHDDRQLRHDPRRQHVALEDLGVAAQRVDPLLRRRRAATAPRSSPKRARGFGDGGGHACMRAPPESQRPMTGALMSIALSMTFWILRACTSDRLPPKTVKS